MADGVTVPSGQPSPRDPTAVSPVEDDAVVEALARDLFSWANPKRTLDHWRGYADMQVAAVRAAETKAKRWDALRGERDRLREALRRFGGHKAGCAFGEVPANNKLCNCGFEAALGSGRPSAPEEET